MTWGAAAHLVVGWEHNGHIIGASTGAGSGGSHAQGGHSCGHSRLDASLHSRVAPRGSCKCGSEQHSGLKGVASLQEVAPVWHGCCHWWDSIDRGDHSCDRDAGPGDIQQGLLQISSHFGNLRCGEGIGRDGQKGGLSSDQGLVAEGYGCKLQLWGCCVCSTRAAGCASWGGGGVGRGGGGCRGGTRGGGGARGSGGSVACWLRGARRRYSRGR